MTNTTTLNPNAKLSVLDMFKIGVGPSSSHTLGPWNAMLHFLNKKLPEGTLHQATGIQIELFGSLSKTGKGHGTDIAVLMGLLNEDPKTTNTSLINYKIQNIKDSKTLLLNNLVSVPFDYDKDLIFKDYNLPYHANALIVHLFLANKSVISETYYSIGGGFFEWESEKQEKESQNDIKDFVAFASAKEILDDCNTNSCQSLSEWVCRHEFKSFSPDAIIRHLDTIWGTMSQCIFQGSRAEGILPGGLNVHRRASTMAKRLMENEVEAKNVGEWIKQIRGKAFNHRSIFKWVSCFALAVNEQNADFGRVVTAPTNGAAGVVPSVLMYYVCFNEEEPSIDDIRRFLLVAAQVGQLFKLKATISAAMGGCQAEIGVSSAMAAAGLTEVLGGSAAQCFMAAEIAMEHHLGLTCDPIGGLVQIPCIERNAMGAIKAITAAEQAVDGDPSKCRVSLDEVIATMWETALDMNSKYKETAEGGLAIKVSINVAEC